MRKGRGEKKIKEKKRIKAERRKKAKPTKLGRVRGAGRARQPPGAAGAPLPTKGPSAAAGLHDIRQPATPSLLNLLLPAPLPAPRRPRGKTNRFGKAGKRRDCRRDAAALALCARPCRPGNRGRSAESSKRVTSQPIKGLLKHRAWSGERQPESDAHL